MAEKPQILQLTPSEELKFTGTVMYCCMLDTGAYYQQQFCISAATCNMHLTMNTYSM